MGREIKRIPMDFNWPMNVTWGGYLNPFYEQSTKCQKCDGSGSTKEYKLLEARWYGQSEFRPEDRGSKPWLHTDDPIRRFAQRNVTSNPGFYGSGECAVEMESKRLCKLFNSQWAHHLNAGDVSALLEANRLHDLTHTWNRDAGWKPKTPPVVPTPKQVNEWSLFGFGHDAINCYIVCNAEAKRLGIETTCKYCDGDGNIWPTPEIKQQYEDWKQTEPPIGDGYQLWETVSEGSPISPVFSSPEELADWLTTSLDYAWRSNDSGTTREQWIKFIRGPGWAPTLILSDGKITTGVESYG